MGTEVHGHTEARGPHAVPWKKLRAHALIKGAFTIDFSDCDAKGGVKGCVAKNTFSLEKAFSHGARA